MTASTRAALEVVLDADALSDLLGVPARATRVRIKPEVSIVVGLTGSDGLAAGWARILWPVAFRKAQRAAARAAAAGLTVRARELPGGLLLHHGPIAADAKLLGLIPDLEPTAIWRYNPLRRVVARTARGIARITADDQRHLVVLQPHLERHLPVPSLVEAGPQDAPVHVTIQQEVGGRDLSRAPQRVDAHRAAGAALARLHAAPLPAGLRPPAASQSTRAIAATHARIVAALEPALAERIVGVAATLPEVPSDHMVLIHGDASPDQVLIDDVPDRIWWTDFDRAALAPAAADIASYIDLTSPDAADAFLDGYADVRPLPDGLPAHITRARIARLAEPLRHAHPDWRQQIARRLDDLQEGPWL